nr:serpin [Tanacetum cinerariifolium]
ASVSFITEKVRKLNSFFESLSMAPNISGTEFVCTKGVDGDMMFIEIVKKDDDSRKEKPIAGGLKVYYFDTNEEDKRIGVEYVMSKILGFYKECLELGPEYVTGMDDEGEVT